MLKNLFKFVQSKKGQGIIAIVMIVLFSCVSCGFLYGPVTSGIQNMKQNLASLPLPTADCNSAYPGSGCEPTVIAQLPPTTEPTKAPTATAQAPATKAPTATAQAPATQAPTATAKPTLAPTATAEAKALNVDELYALERAKWAADPLYHRGENPAVGTKEPVLADASRLFFAGNLDLTINGQTVNVPWPGHPAENVVVLKNASGADIDVQLTGYPQTGFSDWYYKPGKTPEALQLAAVSVGNPTHCGLDAGCPEAHVWQVTWDGTSLTVVSHQVINEPWNLEQAANPSPSLNWDKVSVDEGLEALPKTLSQPATTLTGDETMAIELGVTHLKDMAIEVPAGTKIVDPEGTEYLIETAGVVVLTNNVGDTAVFKVWLPASGTIKVQEFKTDISGAVVGKFLVRAVTEQPREFAMAAADVTSGPSYTVITFGK